MLAVFLFLIKENAMDALLYVVGRPAAARPTGTLDNDNIQYGYHILNEVVFGEAVTTSVMPIKKVSGSIPAGTRTKSKE